MSHAVCQISCQQLPLLLAYFYQYETNCSCAWFSFLWGRCASAVVHACLNHMRVCFSASFCSQEDLKKETLHKQFVLVKKHTNTSHVMQYGNLVSNWNLCWGWLLWDHCLLSSFQMPSSRGNCGKATGRLPGMVTQYGTVSEAPFGNRLETPSGLKCCGQAVNWELITWSTELPSCGVCWQSRLFPGTIQITGYAL